MPTTTNVLEIDNKELEEEKVKPLVLDELVPVRKMG
jgi:hypothetical protein